MDKKPLYQQFDVTMGIFDGAKVGELGGSLILSQQSSIIKSIYMGLYRDNDPIVIRNPKQTKTR